MRDHRKPRAFELADALVVRVYEVTCSFPGEERFGLVSQLRRASVSVPTNIVEGCARATKKEYLHFLQTAFASLREVGYLLDLSRRLGFLHDPEAEAILSQHDEAARTLGALLQSLRQT